MPDDDRRFQVDDVRFWLNSLRSSLSDLTTVYHVAVRHTRLPLHPKRAVPLHYSVAMKMLFWVR